MRELERITESRELPSDLRALFLEGAADGLGAERKARLERTLVQRTAGRRRRILPFAVAAAAAVGMAAAVALFPMLVEAPGRAPAGIRPEPGTSAAPAVTRTSETLEIRVDESRESIFDRAQQYDDTIALKGAAGPVRWRRFHDEEIDPNDLYHSSWVGVYYAAPHLVNEPLPDDTCLSLSARGFMAISGQVNFRSPVAFRTSECHQWSSLGFPVNGQFPNPPLGVRVLNTEQGWDRDYRFDARSTIAQDLSEVRVSFDFSGHNVAAHRVEYDPIAREVALILRERRHDGWYGTTLVYRLLADASLRYARSEAR